MDMEQSEQQKQDQIVKAIYEFYELQHQYKSQYYTKYVLPFTKQEPTGRRKKRQQQIQDKKQRRDGYRQLLQTGLKPACIGCGQHVGSVFSVTTSRQDDGAEIKTYIAKCGDETPTNPCPLHIHLIYDLPLWHMKNMDTVMQSIQDCKQAIIRLKNQAMFFDRQVTTEFEKVSQELTDELDDKALTEKQFIRQVLEPQKEAELVTACHAFNNDYVLPLKAVLANPDADITNEVIHGLTTAYLTVARPLLTTIRNLRFHENWVETKDDTDKATDSPLFTLMQIPSAHSISKNEWILTDHHQILKPTTPAATAAASAAAATTRKRKQTTTNPVGRETKRKNKTVKTTQVSPVVDMSKIKKQSAIQYVTHINRNDDDEHESQSSHE